MLYFLRGAGLFFLFWLGLVSQGWGICSAEILLKELEKSFSPARKEAIERLSELVESRRYSGKMERRIEEKNGGVTVTLVPANKAQAYHQFGALLAVEGLADLGLYLLLKAVILEPKNSLYLSEVGGLLAIRGDPRASCFIREALRHKPPPEALVNAGTYYSLQGKEKKALELFGRAAQESQNPLYRKLVEDSVKRLARKDPEFRELFQQIRDLREDVYRDCEKTFERVSQPPGFSFARVQLITQLIQEGSAILSAIDLSPPHDLEMFEIYQQNVLTRVEEWERSEAPFEEITDRADKDVDRCVSRASHPCDIPACAIHVFRRYLPTVESMLNQNLDYYVPRVRGGLYLFEQKALQYSLSASQDPLSLLKLYKATYLYFAAGCKTIATEYLSVRGHLDFFVELPKMIPACVGVSPREGSEEEDAITSSDLEKEVSKGVSKALKKKIVLDPMKEFKTKLFKKKTQVCIMGQCAGFDRGVGYLKFNVFGVQVKMGFDVVRGTTVGGIGFGVSKGIGYSGGGQSANLIDAGIGVEIEGSGNQATVKVNAQYSTAFSHPQAKGTTNKDFSLITINMNL